MQTPAAAAGKKQRTAADDSDATRIDAAPQLRALKEHLMCAKHDGRFCYVTRPLGEHMQLDLCTLTLWARKMVCFHQSQFRNLLIYFQGYK